MPDGNALDDLVVILDLDGTLVDSAPDLAAAMNIVLEQEGLAAIPLNKVRHLVGHGARALLEKAFAIHGLAEQSPEKMEACLSRFLAHYTAHIADQTRPFPGAEDMLETFSMRGAKLAICTNKREELTYPLLRGLKLIDHFDVVICRDTLPVYKPDPAPLLACVSRSGASRGVMIGDTDTDLHAAMAARMPCLIARFGYGRHEEMDTKKARFFDHFEEVPDLVLKVLK